MRMIWGLMLVAALTGTAAPQSGHDRERDEAWAAREAAAKTEAADAARAAEAARTAEAEHAERLRQEVAAAARYRAGQTASQTADASRAREVARAAVAVIEAARAEASLARRSGASLLTAGEYARAYESNAIRADLLYRGKPVLLKGRISKLGRTFGGTPYLRIEDAVTCYFPAHAAAALARREKGEAVYVLGTGGLDPGLLRSLSLQRCRIVELPASE